MLKMGIVALFLLFGVIRAESVVPWSGQSGAGNSFNVLFNGKIFVNRWWVESFNCPADASPTNWSNPWQFQRDATSDELSSMTNPTSCDVTTEAGGDDGSTGGTGTTTDGGSTGDTFQIGEVYKKGDTVIYGGKEYIATENTKGAFFPGETSVWKEYVPATEWDPNRVYLSGDYAIYEDVVYKAQWWTKGDKPIDNVGDGQNSKVWLPVNDYVQIDPNTASNYDPNRVYKESDVIRYNNAVFIAKHNLYVAGVSPDTSNPWSYYINWDGVKEKVGSNPGTWPKHFFAPYIDASLGYVPDMVSFKNDTGTSHFVLAFLVNTDGTTCSYAWGGVSSVKDGPSGLYSNIKALRESGGDVMISIGGANNNPLAKVCKDVTELKNHYRNIIDNFDLAALDFDIEGGHVSDMEAIERRSKALKMLQDELHADNKEVAIWITLPVLPNGLTANGLDVVRSAMKNGVKLSGINLMTMDYGGVMGCQSIDSNHNRLSVDNSSCDIDATEAVFSQIKSLAQENGLDLTDKDIWAMIGATPMIGVNDQELEVFFIDDAKKLRRHAESVGLGMLSMWSVARDRAAPASQQWQVSPSHSGLVEEQAGDRDFSREFALFDPDNPSDDDLGTGDDSQDGSGDQSGDDGQDGSGDQSGDDGQDGSGDQSNGIPPYIEGKTYQAGDKVSNAGGVYECKPWPYTAWCSGAAWAYEPGVGAYWSSAWIQK
jgi:bifunctional chitinase/lysozyme